MFWIKNSYFREEQDNEFIMLRREFDQVSKNCRILAFKLKKAERRMEELDNEKVENDKKTKEVSHILVINKYYYCYLFLNYNILFTDNRTIAR